jgi:hypothetical protein
MSTADLTKATRELFVRSLVPQVFVKTPFVEEIQRRQQITYTGGRFVEKLVDTAEIDDIVQEYSANSALTDQKKTTLEKPRFTWKYSQLPLRYDVDEFTQNIVAGKEEQLLNLADFLVQKGQRGIKLWLERKLFNEGSDTPVTDASTSFQSLVSALNHDTTYGTISRTFASSTNDWWQGSDPNELVENVTSSAQDTAANITKANLRKWINETSVTQNMEGADDIMVLMSPTNWNKLAAEMEAGVDYKMGLKQSQGIRSMIFDGHEIVSVPYLQKTSNTKTWVFILNLRFWELRIHTERNFKLTDFKWQGENSNGFDFWLARILTSGNFVCWKPNSSMWLSNVS